MQIKKGIMLINRCIFICWLLQGMKVNAQNWEDVSVIMFPDSRLEWTTHNFGRLMGYPAWDPFYWPVNTHHYKSQH